MVYLGSTIPAVYQSCTIVTAVQLKDMLRAIKKYGAKYTAAKQLVMVDTALSFS